MIKRTRLKFFIVMAVIIVTIVAIFCASILIPTHSGNTTETNNILENMIAGFGRPSPQGSQSPQNNRFNEFRGFAVRLNDEFQPVFEPNRDQAIFSDSDIQEYVLKIKSLNKTSGEIDNIKFLIKDTPHGKILAGLDVSMENKMFNQLLTTVLLAGGGGAIVLLILVWFLSFWIIKPAAEAFAKQKRFISEAGHELKTPLTVISAGIELLQKKSSEDDNEKWLKNIKEQVDKMNVMTAELLSLSKIDEAVQITKSEFDLSQIVLTESLAFESVAFENGKSLDCDIENGLIYKGNHQAVVGAVGILCDNAIKYSTAGKTIKISLKRQSSKIILSVANQSDTINKDEIPLLFERFYRGSESRAGVCGAGLGLAILKSLAGQNGWKINADTEQNSITFSIVF